VRNSIPVCNKKYLNYGGNTSCITVESASGEIIAIDGGTGYINFGNKLMAGDFSKGKGKQHLFLSHFHWDHIQGFPFHVPIYIPGNEINIYGFSNGRKGMRDILDLQMQTPFSPLYSLDNCAATFNFIEIGEETISIGGINITSKYFHHSKSKVFGFRLEENGNVLTIILELDKKKRRSKNKVVKFASGTDILIHEAFTMTAEDPVDSTGHSSSNDAFQIAHETGTSTLILNLYSPDIADERIQKQEQALNLQQSRIKVIAAYEGLEIEL